MTEQLLPDIRTFATIFAEREAHREAMMAADDRLYEAAEELRVKDCYEDICRAASRIIRVFQSLDTLAPALRAFDLDEDARRQRARSLLAEPFVAEVVRAMDPELYAREALEEESTDLTQPLSLYEASALAIFLANQRKALEEHGLAPISDNIPSDLVEGLRRTDASTARVKSTDELRKLRAVAFEKIQKLLDSGESPASAWELRKDDPRSELVQYLEPYTKGESQLFIMNLLTSKSYTEVVVDKLAKDFWGGLEIIDIKTHRLED